jgi:hypothetical protein
MMTRIATMAVRAPRFSVSGWAAVQAPSRRVRKYTDTGSLGTAPRLSISN